MTSIRPKSIVAELNENIRKNRFYDILPCKSYEVLKVVLNDEHNIFRRL